MFYFIIIVINFLLCVIKLNFDHRYVSIGKNSLLIGFSTIRSFRHLLGVLEFIFADKGGTVYTFKDTVAESEEPGSFPLICGVVIPLTCLGLRFLDRVNLDSFSGQFQL